MVVVVVVAISSNCHHMSSGESSSGSGTHCCLRYVSLCNFQNVLHSFEIMRAQFENF